jgi:predicted RNase H-related nuclease YkuK (DUF458 family)
MDRQFKTLIKRQDVDLIPYVKEHIVKFPDSEILIGCDSQNQGKKTTYAVVIGMYNPCKGAHVLFSMFEEPRIRLVENSVRLLNEVWFSVEVAEKLKTDLGIIAKWIDIDLNPDPKWQSNKALTNAVGIVTGMGYHVRHKGLSPVMTYAADKLVK